MPVLILSAHEAISGRARSLEAGADDYLAKPFSFDELTTRLGMLVRRDTTEVEPCPIQHPA